MHKKEREGIGRDKDARKAPQCQWWMIKRTRGGQGPPKHFEKYLFYHMMYLYLQVVSLVNTTWPPQFVIKCLNTF